MGFQIFVAYPPDREGRVAQVHVPHDGAVDIPVEMYDEDGERKITIFARTGGVAWEYPLDDFLAAIEAAITALDGPPRPRTTP
jgi:hypothetical protein